MTKPPQIRIEAGKIENWPDVRLYLDSTDPAWQKGGDAGRRLGLDERDQTRLVAAQLSGIHVDESSRTLPPREKPADAFGVLACVFGLLAALAAWTGEPTIAAILGACAAVSFLAAILKR